MRKFFNKYPDLLFMLSLTVLFLVGGGISLLVWSVTRSEWATNFEVFTVDPDQFTSLGTGKDGISPIDEPRFESIDAAMPWLMSSSPVIVVHVVQPARAYPLNVLARHEIINDAADGLYIAVTYCPMCNSPIVYDREVNGDVLRLGVTGNLIGSNFLMWDDRTESWWQQLTGKAIVGEYSGTTLDIIPSQVVGFSTFAERFPDGLVLAGGYDHPGMSYEMNPYMGYEETSPMFGSGDYDTRLMPMQRVLAAEVNGTAVAYAFDDLSAQGVAQDEISGVPIVAFWQPGAVSVVDGATGYTSKDVGQGAIFRRDLDERVLDFRSEEGRIFDVQTGSEWNIFGEAINGELTGSQLLQFQAVPHFWFAWSSAHPDTLLMTGE